MVCEVDSTALFSLSQESDKLKYIKLFNKKKITPFVVQAPNEDAPKSPDVLISFQSINL